MFGIWLQTIDHDRTLPLFGKLEISHECIEIAAILETVLNEDISNEARLELPVAQMKLIFQLFKDMLVAEEDFFVARTFQFVVVALHNCILIEYFINFALLREMCTSGSRSSLE